MWLDIDLNNFFTSVYAVMLPQKGKELLFTYTLLLKIRLLQYTWLSRDIGKSAGYLQLYKSLVTLVFLQS